MGSCSCLLWIQFWLSHPMNSVHTWDIRVPLHRSVWNTEDACVLNDSLSSEIQPLEGRDPWFCSTSPGLSSVPHPESLSVLCLSKPPILQGQTPPWTWVLLVQHSNFFWPHACTDSKLGASDNLASWSRMQAPGGQGPTQYLFYVSCCVENITETW